MKDHSIEGKKRDVVKQFFKLEMINLRKVGYLCPLSSCTKNFFMKFDLYDHFYDEHLSKMDLIHYEH